MHDSRKKEEPILQMGIDNMIQTHDIVNGKSGFNLKEEEGIIWYTDGS
jgi:hypothetical protein